MKSTTTQVKAAVLAVMLLGLSPAISADNGGAEYSEDELKSFLVARAEVREIQAEYSNRLQEETDDQKVAELQAEAQREMVKAVKAEDLSVQQFNRMATKANNDSEFNERLREVAE